MPKINKPVLCYCAECARAKMLQYEHDPVLAECEDGIRNVASSPVMCCKFIIFNGIRCIENLPKKIGF